MASSRLVVRCRAIETVDLDGVQTLLQTGFPERSSGHWVRAFARLSEHTLPPGFPRYGYVLEVDGALVGVILIIFSYMVVDGETRIRGNVTSWYVEPGFRSYATMLTSHALAHKNVTFLNITPAPHTFPILEAQGYQRFGTGQLIAIPALSVRSAPRVRVRGVPPDTRPGEDLSASEVELLLTHAGYGCLSVICESAGVRYPFVFARRRRRWKFLRVPYALLAYCRGVEDFVRFAGPLGRFLARRGMPLVFIDANGPIAGLVGRFVDWEPRFFKGPNPPNLGDVAYTERVMFGL